jgi:hypothetical protein
VDASLSLPLATKLWARASVEPFLLRGDRSVDTQSSEHLGRDALVDVGLLRGSSHITISRESRDDVGFREIFVSLDGTQIAILRHGESITNEVVPGLHRLRAHNTLFWKTHDIILKPGEHARFIAINRAGWGTFGMLFILGAMPVYLTFERAAGPEGNPDAQR